MNRKQLKQIIAEEIRGVINESYGQGSAKNPVHQQKRKSVVAKAQRAGGGGANAASPTVQEFIKQVPHKTWQMLRTMGTRFRTKYKDNDDYKEFWQKYVEKGKIKKALSKAVSEIGERKKESSIDRNRRVAMAKIVRNEMRETYFGISMYQGPREGFADAVYPFVILALEKAFKARAKSKREDKDIKNEVSLLIKKNKAIIDKFGNRSYMPSSPRELNQLFGINSDTLNQQTIASIIAFQEKAFPGQTDEHDGLFGGKTARAYKKMKK